MPMDWKHRVSEDWLTARRDVVTATELQSLMAGKKTWTKAQKAGTKVAPAFAALWGQKHSTAKPDPWSYGPAARGHIMEPHAIQEYNRITGKQWYHWDDIIICNNGLGFSPDAMDIPMPPLDTAKLEVRRGVFYASLITRKNSDVPYVIPEGKPASILEIKSYGIDNHMKNMVTNKESLKERYQIAVAMMVLPTLKEGILVQYNPSTEYSIYDRVYTREDLEQEIIELSETLEMWNKTCRWFEANPPKMQAELTEDEIYNQYLEEWLEGLDAFSF